MGRSRHAGRPGGGYTLEGIKMNNRIFECDDIFDVPGQQLWELLTFFDTYPNLNESDRLNVLGCLRLAYAFHTHEIPEYFEYLVEELLIEKDRILSESEKGLVS